jgi:hypothetical protein
MEEVCCPCPVTFFATIIRATDATFRAQQALNNHSKIWGRKEHKSNHIVDTFIPVTILEPF